MKKRFTVQIHTDGKITLSYPDSLPYSEIADYVDGVRSSGIPIKIVCLHGPLEQSTLLAPDEERYTISLGNQPPQKAVYLLYFFLPKKNRDALLGDLEEEYKEVYARFGERLASVWFYKQVFTSVWPLVSGWFKKPLTNLSKWVEGTVAEAIKRKMG